MVSHDFLGGRSHQVRGKNSPLHQRCQMVGRSPAMQSLYQQIEMISQTDATVLIQGETGVGKNLVARALHQQSARADGPFVSFSAANLSEDLFESELFGHAKGAFSGAHDHHCGLVRAADGGSLFMDETAELSPINQGKLLAFLDDKIARPVGGVRGSVINVRIICSTNQSLRDLVDRGRFRQDLYYRLHIFEIQVPSLKERFDDIPLLVAHFLGRYSRKYDKRLDGVTPEVMDKLCAHPWTGNVRELANEMERLVVMTPAGEAIQLEHVSPEIAVGETNGTPLRSLGETRQPPHIPKENTLEEVRQQAESEHIVEALERYRWNVSAAARELDISRVGLSRKLKRLGIKRPGSTVAIHS